MTQRINEDIRFYLPADPYYYQVDNLPLQDLLNNDVRLQDQIDELTADSSVTLARNGFTELQPFIDGGLPGTVSVRPGNFIGRVQRTSAGTLPGATVDGNGNGLQEQLSPPTDADGYRVSNNAETYADKYVGRNSVFNFFGGNIPIDSFDFDAFTNQLSTANTPPLGRIDLVGITTVNGAMDDPFLPGNPTGSGQVIGDGYPKLAVVKGAGITRDNDGVREVVIGEKYITLGIPQEDLNDYGRDLQGNVVPNPAFGTVPSPDDVVNACFSNQEVVTTLSELATNNENASFFLPLAYVYVPQSYVAGNPVPRQNLKDIRPFFRTAELSVQERQALASSHNPSYRNAVITQSRLNDTFSTEIDRDNGSPTIQAQIQALIDDVQAFTFEKTVLLDDIYRFRNGTISNNTVYNVTNAIRPEHQGKTIKTLKVYMRPGGSTGDIDNGWAGVKTLAGDTIWIMNWGNTIDHSSSILVSPGNCSVNAIIDGDGNVSVKTAGSGTALSIQAYIVGYTYEDTITL